MVRKKVICFLAANEWTTLLKSVRFTGFAKSSDIPNEGNALKRSKEVSGLCHKLTGSLCSDSMGMCEVVRQTTSLMFENQMFCQSSQQMEIQRK